jgi:predicted RNA-binding Zn-ribbon protein involved in translation (DUF1610 family)
LTDETPEKQSSSTTEKKRVVRWRCPNCGQTVFTAPDYEPPDICNYCRDMTTWQRVTDDKEKDNESTS